MGSATAKKAVEKIRSHHRCKQHKNAQSACEYFLSLCHSGAGTSGREQEFSQGEQEAADNRQYLTRLIDIIKTLAKCGLPLRGHDETASSLNKGNFLEVVDLLARWDPILSDYMERSP